MQRAEADIAAGDEQSSAFTQQVSASARPATSPVALPNRRVSPGTAMAAAKLTTVVGRNARPDRTGL